MQVGDKVIVDGKETEITATAFDEEGTKVYMVKGSMKDYYEEELKLLEEDIIKIAESLGYIVGKYGGEKEAKLLNGLVVDCQNKANTIEKLKKENKEQEKMIELMAKGLFDYANLGVLIDCPAEYDGIIDMKFCKMNLKDRNCIVCIKEYYEKKARGE